MEYEDFLIREMNDGPVHWCSQCERDAEDCICEQLCDWLREVDSDTDVCVPAVSEPLQLVAPSAWEKAALAEIDKI